MSHTSHTAPTHTHTHTQVTVLVTDVNDNDPVFLPTLPTTVSLVENAVDNSIVAVLTATDEDSGTNADISYTITGGNDDGGHCMNHTLMHVALVCMYVRSYILHGK